MPTGIEAPAHPAVPGYPTAEPGGEHSEALRAARKRWESEIDADGWEDLGEKDGVRIWSKSNPEDPSGIPVVKGSCIVDDATTEEILAIISQPGMRKLWDPRFDTGFALARYNQESMEFYSVTKGVGYLVSPRDIVGVQWIDKKSERNHPIFVTQTSVTDAGVPPQSGRVRANLRFGGWRIKPTGSGVELGYIVNISLQGWIPVSVVKSVVLDIPSCTGRIRDVLATRGYAPHFERIPDSATLQTETYDAQTNVWRATFTVTPAPGISDKQIRVICDTKRMFKSGVDVTCTAGSANHNRQGVVTIDFAAIVGGQDVELVLQGK